MRLTWIAVPAMLAATVPAWQGPSAAPPVASVDVRGNMVEGVNPAALSIWNVGNSAIDDTGGLDPSLMTPDQWGRLQEAAQSLATYARRLAAAKVIRASGPDPVGGRIPHGVATRSQIQGAIDANPAGFRASASAMERDAKALHDAAARRDVKTAGELIGAMPLACQGCHERYWYPSS